MFCFTGPGHLSHLDNPDCDNRKRAGFASAALSVFQEACHMNEETDIAAGDLICDLLHLVHDYGSKPQRVIEIALDSFVAEAAEMRRKMVQ
jgi:hypothetical protein